MTQNIQIKLGDCIDIMKTIRDNSIDSIVTDPPAGISFMGKEWDKDKGGRDKWIEWMELVAKECLRILKPGGHAFVWALPRTSHWTATAWENAGFEVRDRVGHIFGSGFPKSMNISKQIDKTAGKEQEIIGKYQLPNGQEWNLKQAEDTAVNGSGGTFTASKRRTLEITAPATEESKQWDGWGTALKPATEDWWLFRKPISEKTVTENVLKWGTGAININASRVPVNPEVDDMLRTVERKERDSETWKNGSGFKNENNHVTGVPPIGRWPANLVHDGSDDVLELFPQTAPSHIGKPRGTVKKGLFANSDFNKVGTEHEDSGSAARFFYCAKASRSERNDGLDGIEEKDVPYSDYRKEMKTTDSFVSKYPDGSPRPMNKLKNAHPTVKPLALMRYLITLVTPPNGVVLDPFLGSGSTLVAAKELGFSGRGIEKDPEYFEIAKARINDAESIT